MYDEREHTAPLRLPKMTGGDWYLRGFADAYHRKPAVIPRGPVAEKYKNGYAEGLRAAWRESPMVDPLGPCR